MKHRGLLPAFLLTLLAPVGHAQGTNDDGAADEPLYQVEVIIFRHADQSRTTTEIARMAEPEIADVLDQQLPRLAADEPAGRSTISDETGAETDERLWQPVRTNLQMAADARRIERLDAYELISHLAWRQPAADVSIALPVAATELGAPLPVSGEFKLYRKRYLHLAVDVTLDTNTASSGLSSFIQADPTGPAIVDSRRMRFGRTAYFDQPEFGVIAVVNKVEDPEAG